VKAIPPPPPPRSPPRVAKVALKLRGHAAPAGGRLGYRVRAWDQRGDEMSAAHSHLVMVPGGCARREAPSFIRFVRPGDCGVTAWVDRIPSKTEHVVVQAKPPPPSSPVPRPRPVKPHLEITLSSRYPRVNDVVEYAAGPGRPKLVATPPRCINLLDAGHFKLAAGGRCSVRACAGGKNCSKPHTIDVDE